MRILWTAAIVGWLILAVDAHADTIYLKDGQSVWGSDVTEQGDMVIVVRPGGALRFPKSDVVRIERTKLSIPRFYSPPAGDSGQPAGGEKPGTADRPPTDVTGSPGGPPGPGQQATTTGPPPGLPPVDAPPGPATTVLPPPPPRRPYAPQ